VVHVCLGAAWKVSQLFLFIIILYHLYFVITWFVYTSLNTIFQRFYIILYGFIFKSGSWLELFMELL